MTSEPVLVIGALSQQASVNIETIRYYERIGLLPRPRRSNGGHRLYGRADVMRLSFIRRARELGFSLDQVRALLGLAQDRPRSCGAVHAVAAAHLREVETKIADLRRLRRVLREMVARCREGALLECPIIETLFSRGAALAARPPTVAVRRGPGAIGDMLPRSDNPPRRRARNAR